MSDCCAYEQVIRVRILKGSEDKPTKSHKAYEPLLGGWCALAMILAAML